MNIAGSVLNAVIAGSIVAVIGEASIYAFEMVYKGEKTLDDLEWLRNLIKEQLDDEFISKVTDIINELAKNADAKDVMQLVATLITAAFGISEGKK